MNKTLSVNIGGIVFHIEEHAFDKLNNYLETIRGYFTTSDGRDEIIQDIESRIAEMFQERISNSKQVIVLSDVEHIISVMGKPEQFAPESEGGADGTSGNYESATQGKKYRRLYRDSDDRIIGGVCSGISHYLNVDPIWLRLVFAIALFVFGSGVLLYFLLMIIMPKAKTTAEKLEMRGEKVDVSSISRSRLEERDSEPNIATRVVDAVGQLLMGLFRVIGKIITVFFIIIGLVILAAFGLTFLALIGVGSISIPFFITDLFLSPWQQTMSLTGAFLIVGIPVLYVIYRAVRSLFKITAPDKFVGWTALALWIIGIVISSITISSVASEFKAREVSRTVIPIVQPANDTLNLEVKMNNSDNEWIYINNHKVNDPWTVTSDIDTIRMESVTLDVVRAAGNEFELIQMSKSRGPNRQKAIANARSIIYHVEQEGNELRFDDTFVLPAGTMYRGQELQLTLKVPEGKSVRFSEDLDQIIYDVENVTNTYDGDMVGKVWTMTSAGLECVGCNLGSHRTNYKNDDVQIHIDKKGVHVMGTTEKKDTTIIINSKDVDIKIHDNGVKIESRKK